MPELPDDFRCPLCRSVKYERIVVKGRAGSSYVTDFFRCCTCTVMFMNPLAFTHGYEDRPMTVKRQSNVTPFQAWSRINDSRKDPSK
jgi:hypothetical protein